RLALTQLRNGRSAGLQACVLVFLVVLAALTLYGFSSVHPLDPHTWYPDGPFPLVQFTGIYAVCATAILIFLPWAFARLCAAALVLLTATLIPLPLLAVAFVLLSAWCLGRMLGGTSVMALLTGLAIYLAAMPFIA